MAIEPKSPRKRAVKKVSKKKSLAAESQRKLLTHPVAEAVESKIKKKAPAIPVPIFQAAQLKRKLRRRTAKKSASKTEATEGSAESKSADGESCRCF
jgi:ribonuclease E